MVEKAKELCEDLIANVKEQYEEFKARPPRYQGGGGDRGGYGGHHRGNHDNHGSHGGSYGGYGGGYGSNSGAAASNSPAPPGVNSPSSNAAADYAAQYAQYYGSADPYAAYGGYAKSVLPRYPGSFCLLTSS